MTKPVAWSYSRLTSYETCARRYWHLMVKKDLKEEPSQAMIEGNDTHKAFELRIRDGKQLPIHLRVHEPALAIIASTKGDKIVEQQIALNPAWEPVEWFDRDAWLRVKSDLTQYNGKYGVVWDWKTGRPHDDFTQLNLNAAVLLHLAPEIEVVNPAYYWTKSRHVAAGDRITRDKLPDIWGPILARVAEYQRAHEAEAFPPKENYFCRGCPVKDCQYWKPKK
jgi:PD-(D/E)XK nuclease superfamily